MSSIYNILAKLNAVIGMDAPAAPKAEAKPLYESVEARGSITEAVRSLEAKFATFKESKLDDLADKKKEKDANSSAFDTKAKPAANKKEVKGTRYGADKADLDEGKLDDLADAKAEKEANAKPWEKKSSDKKSDTTKVAGNKYGGSKQADKDDLDEADDNVFHNPTLPANQQLSAPPQEINIDEAKVAPKFTVVASRRGKDRAVTRTIPELVEYYRYTLEVGKSYEHERGNAKINMNPKNIEALVKNLNYAKSNGAANGSPDTYYYVGDESQAEVEQPAIAEGKNHMGEREYQSYASWKAACKKAYPGCEYRGDKDICAATMGSKDVGEWDGAVGSVFVKQTNESKIDDLNDAKAEKEANAKPWEKKSSDKKSDTTKVAGDKYGGSKQADKDDLEEAYEFKSKDFKNSSKDLKKVTKKTVKEGRNHQSSEYTYEIVADTLHKEQPDLVADSQEFQDAVYHELMSLGMTPRSARHLTVYDEDFMTDTVSAYNHNKKNTVNHAHDAALEDITKLAGLAKPLPAGASTVGPLDEEDFPAAPPSDIRRYGIDEEDNDFSGDEFGGYDDVAPADEGDYLGTPGETYYSFEEWKDAVDAQTGGAYTIDSDDGHYTAHKTNDEGNSSYSPDELVGVWMEPDGEGKVYEANPVDESWDDTDGYESNDPTDPAYANKRTDLASTHEAPIKGSKFSMALEAAKANSEKEFAVDGTPYTVKESKIDDLNDAKAEKEANAKPWEKKSSDKKDDSKVVKGTQYGGSKQADEKDDVAESINLMRKLSGMPTVESAEKPRDIEYVNTPREKTAPVSAAIPSGTDLNKSKRQDPKTANKSANPLAQKVDEAKVIENALWNKYAGYIQDLMK